ncbi:MAG TPA: pitrilysin family protein, partial [Armatimonadota bacterium]|nr:pitrilysin family protein [Armatimonadota bacterium]
AVEDIGASFNIWAGTEEAGFSAKCLDRDLGRVLDVLGEVLAEPAFAEAEIEKTRGELLTGLREQEDSTRAQAELALIRMLYPPEHPYARSSAGTRDTVCALTQAELEQFHHAWYAPQGMKVSVAGALDAGLLREKLSGWLPGKRAAEPPADLSVSPSLAGGLARAGMPHKSQVDIIMGGPGVRRHDPDFYALWMVNLILGGLGLMGRLGERVRDEQGIAYHVSCRAASRLWAGEWTASAGVAPQNVDRAIEAILVEVERIRSELVTEQELADAAAYLTGSIPVRMETNDGIAGYMLNTEYYGLGLDYVYRAPEYIRSQTRERLREAARRHMDPGGFSIAMAGPV